MMSSARGKSAALLTIAERSHGTLKKDRSVGILNTSKNKESQLSRTRSDPDGRFMGVIDDQTANRIRQSVFLEKQRKLQKSR